MRRNLPPTDKEQTPNLNNFIFSLGRWPIQQSGTLGTVLDFYLLQYDFSFIRNCREFQLWRTFLVLKLLHQYSIISALRGTLPLFGETQANSPSLSSSICERLVWHFCPREGCETLNLHLNSHLIFYGYVAMLKYSTRTTTTSASCLAVPAWSYLQHLLSSSPVLHELFP